MQAVVRQKSQLVLLAGEATLPTRHGDFRIVAFETADGKEHVALVRGDLRGRRDVLVRIHSECFTGDVMGSLRCDCRDQLDASIDAVAANNEGVIVYLRQEGRGIGLINKVRAYALQETGLDTVDANVALGFQDDEREYGVAGDMLRLLGVVSVRLMTNNPRKVSGLEAAGIEVAERIPLKTEKHRFNERYLDTKRIRCGHDL